MTKNQHLLPNYQHKYNGEAIIGDDSSLPVLGCGDVIDNAKFGKGLHVPRIGPNLLSIHFITHTRKKAEY